MHAVCGVSHFRNDVECLWIDGFRELRFGGVKKIGHQQMWIWKYSVVYKCENGEVDFGMGFWVLGAYDWCFEIHGVLIAYSRMFL